LDVEGLTIASRTSAVARLTLSAKIPPVLELTPNPSGDSPFLLKIQGHPGRSYWVRSQRDFPGNEIIHSRYGPSALPIRIYEEASYPGAKLRSFFAASIYEPSNPICHLNLSRLRFAMERLAADLRKKPGAESLSEEELYRYLALDPFECPEGGSYIFSTIGNDPYCTFAEHSLEENR
jgi:hypothetical protein